jgi:hypothetical protein
VRRATCTGQCQFLLDVCSRPSDGRSQYTTSESDLPIAADLAAHSNSLNASESQGLQLQYNFLRTVVQSRTEGCGGVYLSSGGTTYETSPRAQHYGISTLHGKLRHIELLMLQPFSRANTYKLS